MNPSHSCLSPPSNESEPGERRNAGAKGGPESSRSAPLKGGKGMGSVEMDLVRGGDERNPSSNGGPERNPSANRGPEKELEKVREKEGRFLLGSPTFSDLGNGRLRCVETGHELPAKDRESYTGSKGCRLALIDAAVSQKKPPLNVFQSHPLSKSKLFCELTGDTINKSEEHIWKHISGKKFHNQLELMEVDKLASAKNIEKNRKLARMLLESRMLRDKKDQKQDADGAVEKDQKQDADGAVMKDQKQDADGNESSTKKSDFWMPSFWMPPIEMRWDSDDKIDRCGFCGSSKRETNDDFGSEVEEENDFMLVVDDEDDVEPTEVDEENFTGSKRMPTSTSGRSSFSSRKKKKIKKC